MPIKDSFLSEVKKGQILELMVGSKELSGRIVNIENDEVKLKRDNGREANIALDSIVYYEIISDTSQPERDGSLQSQTQKETPIIDYRFLDSKVFLLPKLYWENNIEHLKISNTVIEACTNIDPSKTLLSELRTVFDRLSYCIKVKEFDFKFGRIQPILGDINRLCDLYKNELLDELLVTILYCMKITYKGFFNKIVRRPWFIIEEAVLAYEQGDFDNMTVLGRQYFSNQVLTNYNIDNFLFLLPHFIDFGHIDTIISKENEIKYFSKEIQNSYDKIYNIAKSTKLNGISKKNKPKQMSESINKKEVTFPETKLAEKVHQLHLSEKYIDAYKMVEKEYKANPENQEILDLFQYVSKVKRNLLKFRSLPKGNSYYAKASRDIHIYENFESAKENFKLSIFQKEERSFSAIMDYTDLIARLEGEKSAIKSLKSFKNYVKPLNETKYYEKLCSLYQKDKDYDNLLEVLRILLKKYSKDKKYNIYFRMATCYRTMGKFSDAINLAKEAIKQKGSKINVCTHFMVNCYLEIGDFERAREVVKEYIDDGFITNSLLEIISRYQSEKVGKEDNFGENVIRYPVDIMGLNDLFIQSYLETCSYEGIPEVRKLSGDYNEEDLEKLKSRIQFLDKKQPKDQAAHFLTAALLEKSLNTESEKYREYLSQSMRYKGDLFFQNQLIDCARSYYLTAIRLSVATEKESKLEGEALLCYLRTFLSRNELDSLDQIEGFKNKF